MSDPRHVVRRRRRSCGPRRTRASELAADGVPERLSVATLYELYWGVGYVDAPQAEKDAVDAVFETKEIDDVTPGIARKAGRIAGELSSRAPP